MLTRGWFGQQIDFHLITFRTGGKHTTLVICSRMRTWNTWCRSRIKHSQRAHRCLRPILNSIWWQLFTGGYTSRISCNPEWSLVESAVGRLVLLHVGLSEHLLSLYPLVCHNVCHSVNMYSESSINLLLCYLHLSPQCLYKVVALTPRFPKKVPTPLSSTRTAKGNTAPEANTVVDPRAVVIHL